MAKKHVDCPRSLQNNSDSAKVRFSMFRIWTAGLLGFDTPGVGLSASEAGHSALLVPKCLKGSDKQFLDSMVLSQGEFTVSVDAEPPAAVSSVHGTRGRHNETS